MQPLQEAVQNMKDISVRNGAASMPSGARPLSKLPSWGLALVAFTISLAEEARPNILLMLADDLGYQDLSCYGSTAVQTPHLDALAASGIRMDEFYTASAVCTPTRASILTGLYPLRLGITRHFKDDEAHLPSETITLPELLQDANYHTAHVGKWHLGGLHLRHIADRANSIPGPHEHGFDHYQCQNEEPPLRGQMGADRVLYRKGGTCLIRNEKQVTPDDPYYSMHFTDINGDETVKLIHKYSEDDRPFFINTWWFVPHTPFEPAPEPHWTNAASLGISDDQRRFRSMVQHMDAKIGEIIKALEATGQRENTLILFLSDNGAAYEGQIGLLRGGKTDLHDGGIKVPFIASWPRRIPAGQRSNAFGVSTDLMPTLCAAAGIPFPIAEGVDGVDLLPHWLGGPAAGFDQRGTVFWQLDLYNHLQRQYPKPEPYATEVARAGRWKLLAMDGNPVALYDMLEDPYERENVLKARPEIVRRLREELQSFLSAPRLSPYNY